jgi:translation initiation factor 2B subunit (eIF-2B alpha/beta/delta family)
MDGQAHLEALVEPLRADTLSGAAAVASTASQVLRRGAFELPGDTAAEVRESLAFLAVKVLDAQPAMAPLVALAAQVLDAARGATDPHATRSAAADAAERFRARLAGRQMEVARLAARLLPPRGTVLTVSSSSTVRDALLFDAAGRDLRVVCLEGRPMCEGRLMSEALAGAGIAVVYAVDAAADTLVAEADLVLMGADSIGDRGVVNKIGSLAVALAAGRGRVPVHVVADETKILPPGIPQSLADDRPASEVWDAPRGVVVWNRYFEALSLETITSVVTDEATYRPDELESRRREARVPDEIRAWARAHGAERRASL